MKKKITILLVLLMVIGMITGCSKKEEGTDEPKDQLDAIKAAGKLVVGIEGTYPPFNFVDDNGNYAGYDVDVATAVAEHIGVEVEFVMAEWDALLVGIDSQRWDTVIADVTATDERREKYDFSEPYLFTGRQVVVKTGNEVGLHSLDDIKGKKVATNATNSWASKLEALGAEIVPIDNTDQCAQAVINGTADFCMFNNIVMGEYLKNHPEAELEVAFVIETDVNEVSIPCRKGEERLLAEFNAALQELRSSGKLAELSNKWFYDDLTNNPLN
ncbi:MAG: transporter substrate-binding domain-containing protein [Erysipelotrichaceae bacterium]|nr:transporter substrate-binding domain-containing protein [Erysipelotrichaceae bacterium]